jgi:diacylglycerol kinase family enzyme
MECVINNGATVAYRLGPDGQTVAEIEPHGLLFRGRVMLAGAGTTPYYGYDFRMFPYAGRRRGMMHLKLSAMSTTEVLANLPALWQGRCAHPNLHNFHVQEAHIRFDRPMPMQIGGDPEGYREKLTLSVAPEQLELVDFTGSVN